MRLTFVILIAILSSLPALAAEEGGGAGQVKEEASFKRLTFDVGGDSNLSNGSMTYEGHVGINYHVLEWLTWRNAPFYRKESNIDPSYGLDSSLQGNYGIKVSDDLTGSLVVGGGYRLTNLSSEDAPFIEGGLNAHLKGMGLGATVKRIFHSAMTTGMSDETLFGVNVSGGLNF